MGGSFLGFKFRTNPGKENTQKRRLFCFIFVTQRVYSQPLVSYWSHRGYILSIWYPIGHTEGIFSAFGLLLVTQRVYSQHLVSYWAHKGYILSIWYPIGHTEGIFSASGILLGTQRVYSHPLIPHLSVPVTLWG